MKEVTLEYVGRYAASGGVEAMDGSWRLDGNGCVTVPAAVAESLLLQEGEWRRATAKTDKVKEASDG